MDRKKWEKATSDNHETITTIIVYETITKKKKKLICIPSAGKDKIV